MSAARLRAVLISVAFLATCGCVVVLYTVWMRFPAVDRLPIAIVSVAKDNRCYPIESETVPFPVEECGHIPQRHHGLIPVANITTLEQGRAFFQSGRRARRSLTLRPTMMEEDLWRQPAATCRCIDVDDDPPSREVHRRCFLLLENVTKLVMTSTESALIYLPKATPAAVFESISHVVADCRVWWLLRPMSINVTMSAHNDPFSSSCATNYSCETLLYGYGHVFDRIFGNHPYHGMYLPTGLFSFAFALATGLDILRQTYQNGLPFALKVWLLLSWDSSPEVGHSRIPQYFFDLWLGQSVNSFWPTERTVSGAELCGYRWLGVGVVNMDKTMNGKTVLEVMTGVISPFFHDMAVSDLGDIDADKQRPVLYVFREREWRGRWRGIPPEVEGKLLSFFNSSVGAVRTVRFEQLSHAQNISAKLDVAHQLHSIRSSTFVVAAEGAAFAWLPFAKPNTTFVMIYEQSCGAELSHPQFHIKVARLRNQSDLRLIVYSIDCDGTAVSLSKLFDLLLEPFSPGIDIFSTSSNMDPYISEMIRSGVASLHSSHAISLQIAKPFNELPTTRQRITRRGKMWLSP